LQDTQYREVSVDDWRANMNRRAFGKAIVAGLGQAIALPLLSAKSRRLKAGHTGITWGNDIEKAIQDCGALGFHGFETFGQVLQAWEAKGGLEKLLDENQLPLISAYCAFNMTDPTRRKDELEKMTRWGGLIKKYGGKVCVMGPNGVKRDSFSFANSMADIVASLNEVAKAMTDMGLTAVLHQHTGTCVMTRDEVYGVLHAVDTRYVKFGPDVGQLAKGGNDPVQVITDFLPLIRHVHLKDWDGGPYYVEYCPLGMGKVDLPKVIQLLEHSGNELTIMAELDPSPNMPLTATQAATINRDYLQKMGYKFRHKG
jgi:inosose dehydratase